MDARKQPVVIGWRERVDLPDWGIRRLRGKMDTGARTSSLHVENLEILPEGLLRFDVVVRLEPLELVTVTAPRVRTAKVRPSTGSLQQRPVVRTNLRLAGITREVEFSLVSREHMLSRMLVGRTALRDAFLVDPGARYLHRRRKKKSP